MPESLVLLSAALSFLLCAAGLIYLLETYGPTFTRWLEEANKDA